MKRFIWVVGLPALLFLAACSGSVEDEAGKSAVLPSGPALIMFYTDN